VVAKTSVMTEPKYLIRNNLQTRRFGGRGRLLGLRIRLVIEKGSERSNSATADADCDRGTIPLPRS
jgi:hypothetical protein